MELIVTEKNNAARRIADILSEGGASTDTVTGVNVYKWGGRRCIGLSGHVVGVDFPPEYSDWRDVEPAELVHADVVKEPTQEDIVNALQRLAREADDVVIATDYDREGELIGKEAYELVREVNEDVPVKRVRFSSITENEVRSAFADPDDIDFDLAAAGEARQIIDLMWGAALTRFLSLSARQMGDDFISVGRVQTPTLKLIVDKEREIEAFEPDDYWELFADLTKDGVEFEAQYFYEDEAGNEAERVWDEADAEAAFDVLESAGEAVVQSVSRRTRSDDPPAPFNTTQFIRAAGSLGYSAGRAMSIAEDLYTAGYITYPRTDNTVYPEDLDERELLEAFSGTVFGDDADSLLEHDDLSPTEGDEETTDHPPIHPTADFPDRNQLSEDEWEVYELVVRRFFATLAEPAVWEHLRVVADADGESLKANGKRLVERGYHDVYPYFNTSENYVPDVDEGDALALADARMEAKQTQPPRRYGQSRLIETMEELGVGTKCLTDDSKVLVRDDSGDVTRIPVSELFESGQVALADGNTDVAVVEDGPTTLSFEERTERIVDREQTLVSERPLNDDEHVYSVDTEAGSFSATGEHPVYLVEDGAAVVKPLAAVDEGDRLLTTRQSPSVDATVDETVVTWREFAAGCDKDSKLYGVDCGDVLADCRRSEGETQAEFAERLDTHRPQVTRYENGDMDVPVWLLGEVGIRPDAIHGLNYETTVENPFPLDWSPALARVLGSLLGDGSIHVNDEENVVDIRYHNTDERLVDRFVEDIETLFGVEPSATSREGRKPHHKRKYQVHVPSAVARILTFVLESVAEDGCPRVPEPLEPVFVGALFDDEGHISTDGKVFITNIDHALLDGVAEMLDRHGIESTLNESQHKLYVRGRCDLERFLDTVPIAADEKFYRGIQRLERYKVTTRKARVLETIDDEALTTFELAERLDETVAVVRTTLSELDGEGYVERHIEGSNRSHDDNRTFRYSTDSYRESVYATLRGKPASTVVTSITERDYDGPVYDLTIDESAPNFAVEGGIVVHNSTRHNTLEKLYDRGYIEDNPPRPTTLAKAVVEAAEEYADLVVSEEMTAELEADMTAIANGEKTLDDVTEESRELLDRVFDELTASREDIGEHLRTSLKADKTLGPCPECGDTLLVRRSRTGSYFVGCDGYPECRFTLPLPSTGEPIVLDEACDEHDLNEVKMLAGRNTFVHGCPLCAAEAADESEDRVIGDCPECGGEHGGDLAIKQLPSGSRLVGCTRYPDCEYSLPLPRRGDIEVTDDYCDEHDLPELLVFDGEDDDEPWELGCPICNYEEYQERQRQRGLEVLDGIGPKTAEKLEDAGIEDVGDLAEAEPEAVADQVSGVSADSVREWQAKAD
ncbi:MAG: DNA topoisomerase I [Halobacterium sp.]